MLLGEDEVGTGDARVGRAAREVYLGEGPLAVKGDIVVHNAIVMHAPKTCIDVGELP
jgi:hypothetical protein